MDPYVKYYDSLPDLRAAPALPPGWKTNDHGKSVMALLKLKGYSAWGAAPLAVTNKLRFLYAALVSGDFKPSAAGSSERLSSELPIASEGAADEISQQGVSGVETFEQIWNSWSNRSQTWSRVSRAAWIGDASHTKDMRLMAIILNIEDTSKQVFVSQKCANAVQAAYYLSLSASDRLVGPESEGVHAVATAFEAAYVIASFREKYLRSEFGHEAFHLLQQAMKII